MLTMRIGRVSVVAILLLGAVSLEYAEESAQPKAVEKPGKTGKTSESGKSGKSVAADRTKGGSGGGKSEIIEFQTRRETEVWVDGVKAGTGTSKVEIKEGHEYTIAFKEGKKELPSFRYSISFAPSSDEKVRPKWIDMPVSLEGTYPGMRLAVGVADVPQESAARMFAETMARGQLARYQPNSDVKDTVEKRKDGSVVQRSTVSGMVSGATPLRYWTRRTEKGFQVFCLMGQKEEAQPKAVEKPGKTSKSSKSGDSSKSSRNTKTSKPGESSKPSESSKTGESGAGDKTKEATGEERG